ncbi:ectonucleotide pyrophosphatase/phosphodiesterase family member 5-like [Branchiostoma floridae]|uniref:Ectonucleotide pyrophosphatase/phosphodiesterase family member 5-like n=1 Tax=Branchiostoma floridae TaxID=7739 RepID=A0A9J7MLT8_BRAFL|nr:ectonucleotide pyrophosphatase/phosphodiesterase family member 5-like [Branchiostoma floridae]
MELYPVYLLCFLCLVRTSLQKSCHKTLLVSFDGCRWDFINRGNTPTFDRLAREGVRAPYIHGTFITKTFPSHWSVITGLWEESHGITANSMYDSVLNQTFVLRTKDPEWWDVGSMPVWQTAQSQGLKAADLFWPGGDVLMNGQHVNIYRKYNQSMPFTDRVDTVVGWFVKENVDFATLYFHQPDETAHIHGPDSQNVTTKMAELDGVLQYLLQKVEDAGLSDQLNIIVTADHGMAEISRDRKIQIYNYVDRSLISRIPDAGPVANIQPVDGKLQEVYNILKAAHPNMTVYLREEVPERMHYTHNRRIMPIVALADEGWEVIPSESEVTDYKLNLKGAHGYDNMLMNMKPIFLARGPRFKRGYQATPFYAVDIYNLICELLGVTPAPNNGTWERVSDLLVPLSAGDVTCGGVSLAVSWASLLLVITSLMCSTLF